MLKKSNFAYFKDRGKLMIPVCLFAIFDSAFTSFSPVLAKIAEVFPDASTTTIQMILTMPSLTLIPASIFAGFLATYVHKKHIALFALAVMMFGGLFPLASHGSLVVLFFSSAMIGVGQGLIKPLASSIICEYFDGREKGTVLGFKQAANYLGAAALTILVGFLSAYAWYSVYWVYVLVIPSMLVTALFLPKGKLEVKFVGKGVGLKGVKGVFTPAFIYMSVICFLAAALSFAFYTNVAMMIVEKGLGGAEEAAKVVSLNSVLSFFIGLSFGLILRAFKKYSLALGFAVLALACGLLAFSTSFSVILVGGIVFGLGNGLQEIGTIYYVSESIHKSSATMAMSITMAVISLGITLSPVLTNAVKQWVFHSTTAASSLLVAVCGYAILLITEIIRETFFNKGSQIGLSIEALDD